MYQSDSICAIQYRSCLSSSTWLFPKASGSKCVDYSRIHLYNACDNGIKQLPWEQSVWRMDYSKALPMDVEPRSYHKQSASQVGALPQKSVLMPHFMSTCYLPHFMSTCYSLERKHKMWRPQSCMFESVITIGALQRLRYTSSISNLHLLYIRTVHMARVYLLFSRP